MSEKEKDHKKIYVKLSNESIDNLDKIAKRLGMSRSSLIAYYVGQGISNELTKERLLSPESMAKMLELVGLDSFMPKEENIDV